MILKIGNIKISNNFPARTIAEAAVEHLGSLNVAKKMALTAKNLGADFIMKEMMELLLGGFKQEMNQ